MICFLPERCTACGGCVPFCPDDALALSSGSLIINESCSDCGQCAPFCPHAALVPFDESIPSWPELRPPHDSYDIVVIGGGPAGATAARFAAEAGANVLLMEKKPIVGVPQSCGEAVSHYGLTQVIPKIQQNWIAAPIVGALLISPRGNETRVRHSKAGYVLERRVFDRDLFLNAAKAGVRTLTSAEATGLIWDSDNVIGVEYSYRGQVRQLLARIIIVADGIGSNIARWLFPDERLGKDDVHIAAQVVMSGVEVEVGFPEFHVGRKIAPGGYAWVFPKGEDWANVGLGVNPSMREAQKFSSFELLTKFIEKRFGGSGEIVEFANGNIPTARRLPRIAYRNIMFVGDAGRLIDPLSGGGIATALLSGKIAGELAADSLRWKTPEQLEGALGAYHKLWDRAKGKQLAFYARAKEIFSRLPDPELESICRFIDERFGQGEFDGIDIPRTLRAILRRRSLLWQLFKALFPIDL